MKPSEAWGRALASWAIPPEIMADAPEDPWAYPVGRFIRAAEEALVRDTPSLRRALEALPPGGTVLDVGCGAGAASLPLAPPASALTGVDENREMLDAFAKRAAALGVTHREILGRWPEEAPYAGMADVVVSHHVLYNVQDIVPFVRALTGHARRRVVVEMTAEHPRSWESPLWRELHRIERPLRPTADDAVEVLLSELNLPVSVDRWGRKPTFAAAPIEELVPMIRVDLCLRPERDPEIARALAANPPPKERGIVTLWWDVR